MTTPTSSTLAIIVVNYGTHALVESNLLASLDDAFAGQVVIVDNLASIDDRRAMEAACLTHGWTFVASADNSGFGGGNNQGVAAARDLGCQEYLFLNPDASITAASISGLHARVLADPMLLVAPLVLRPDGSVFSDEVDLLLDSGTMRSRARRPAQLEASRTHTWVSGACFALTDTLWTAIGGFDESYFLYWEDVDLCHRAQLAGGTVEVDHTCQAVHDEGQTHGQHVPERAKSALYYRFNTRNRLVYAAKHLSRADRRRWLRATPAASYAIVLQGGRRQFLRPDRSLWPALQGTWSGLLAYRRLVRSR